MKYLYAFLGIVILICGTFYLINRNNMLIETTIPTDQTEVSPVIVTPIMHATLLVSWAGKTVFVDPTGGAESFVGKPVADIVLVTDIHGDHLSTSTLAGVVGSSTTLIVPSAVAELLPADLASKAIVMNNGDTRTEQGFQIGAMPMYNLPESPESRHVKGRGNGYIIEKDGYRVYIAGDTAGIPEMRALTSIDIAFVPMNLPFTMTVEEAADAVLDFKPKTVYPYHYRGQNGLSDINKFKKLVNAGDSSINVIFANWYPEN